MIDSIASKSLIYGSACWARTSDPLINSFMLERLKRPSYAPYRSVLVLTETPVLASFGGT